MLSSSTPPDSLWLSITGVVSTQGEEASYFIPLPSDATVLTRPLEWTGTEWGMQEPVVLDAPGRAIEYFAIDERVLRVGNHDGQIFRLTFPNPHPGRSCAFEFEIRLREVLVHRDGNHPVVVRSGQDVGQFVDSTKNCNFGHPQLTPIIDHYSRLLDSAQGDASVVVDSLVRRISQVPRGPDHPAPHRANQVWRDILRYEAGALDSIPAGISCEDRVTGACAVLRGLRIPARMVKTVVAVDDPACEWDVVDATSGPHMIGEYFDRQEWVPFDPTCGRTADCSPQVRLASAKDPEKLLLIHARGAQVLRQLQFHATLSAPDWWQVPISHGTEAQPVGLRPGMLSPITPVSPGR